MSIAEDYNNWAKIYDNNANKTRDLDKLATIEVLRGISFKKVLELGCGTGKNTQFLLQKNASVTGLDFSNEMLAKAKEKIQDKRVQFILTDLNSDWPTPVKSFDLVTCSLTLEHIADLNSFFKKAHESLAASGYFFVCELHPYKQYLGSKARFEHNGNTTFLEVYKHHLSDYLNAAEKNHFKAIKIQEWFDADQKEVPRLILFLFQKED